MKIIPAMRRVHKMRDLRFYVGLTDITR